MLTAIYLILYMLVGLYITIALLVFALLWKADNRKHPLPYVIVAAIKWPWFLI